MVAGEIRPDGDVVLPEEAVQGFHPPRCLVCASDLVKPDVVFFGESVPKPLVERCFDVVERSRGLLVLGSSLQVMSGYRFVRRAAALSLPVAIVTRGATRGDAQATIRLDAPLGRHADPPGRRARPGGVAGTACASGAAAAGTPAPPYPPQTRRRTAVTLPRIEACVAVDGGVGLVVRHQPHVAVLALERLDRRLVVEHGRDDVAVVGRRLLPHDDPVAVADGRVDHGVTDDLEQEQLALADELPGQREDVLDDLLGQDRATGGDPADDRDVGRRRAGVAAAGLVDRRLDDSTGSGAAEPR